MTNDYNRTTVIPEYPFWAASKPEYVFGAPSERYLDISKGEAGRICDALPKETAAADELFATGVIVHHGLDRGLSPDIAPEQIRDTIGALLRSRGPSHEIKIATVAVALHHWFNQEIAA